MTQSHRSGLNRRPHGAHHPAPVLESGARPREDARESDGTEADDPEPDPENRNGIAISASPHRGRGDAWGIGALLVLCLALAGCQRGRITEPGGEAPCFAWVIDTASTVTVVGYPGATAYVKRCVVGGGR